MLSRGRGSVTAHGGWATTFWEPIDNASSRIRWNRTYTALNERGNAFIKELTGPEYDDEIRGLETMLNHFCRTGEMLPVARLAK